MRPGRRVDKIIASFVSPRPAQWRLDWIVIVAVCLVLGWLLAGCVSVGYMERRVQDVEDRLTECQQNWQSTMREADSCLEDLKELKAQPGFKLDLE